MNLIRRLTTYITIIILTLNSSILIANTLPKLSAAPNETNDNYDADYYDQCKIGKEAKNLKQSFFSLPFMKDCSANFRELTENSRVNTSRFYGELEQFYG